MAHGPGYTEHPEHTVVLRPTADHVKVVVAGRTIAKSDHPIVVEEMGHDPVHDIPREDVDMGVLEPEDKRTSCPCMGEARYYRVSGAVGAAARDDVAWTYERPWDETRSLEGYLAFDKERVDAIDITQPLSLGVGTTQASS